MSIEVSKGDKLTERGQADKVYGAVQKKDAARKPDGVLKVKML